MNSPHQVTRDFEAALCEYTGARYAVTVTSCTAALLLVCRWWCRDENQTWGAGIGVLPPFPFTIPKRTYVSVPMSIINAGGQVFFRDEDWSGAYQLAPYPIWDSARRFTSGMFMPGQFQCVSFHVSKILGDTQGGAILHDSPEADAWFRRMRFDGRTEGVAPKDDDIREVGYHYYMSPDVAARLLHRLSFLPRVNNDLPNSEYPDLSTFEIFK